MQHTRPQFLSRPAPRPFDPPGYQEIALRQFEREQRVLEHLVGNAEMRELRSKLSRCYLVEDVNAREKCHHIAAELYQHMEARRSLPHQVSLIALPALLLVRVLLT